MSLIVYIIYTAAYVAVFAIAWWGRGKRDEIRRRGEQERAAIRAAARERP